MSVSLFEESIKTPEWFKPIENFLYEPCRLIKTKIDRPEDQVVYMVASIFALICCFTLKAHPGSAF